MDTSVIIGNESLKKELETPFHAYIIEGPHGSGKTLVARLIAQANICVASGQKPCGKCYSCLKFVAESNIDVRYMSSDIDVKSLREELSDIYIRPNESEKRCYVMEDCDNLSILCQNVLLKSLEEPPEFSVFILTCESKEKLLETLRSRCLVLTLAPVRDSEALEFFKQAKYSQFSFDQKKRAIRLSGGLLGRAVEILEDRSYDLYESCEKFINCCLSGSVEEIIKIVSFKTREELQHFCRTLYMYISENIRESSGSSDFSKLCSLGMVVETVVEQIEYNINVRLWNVILIERCLEVIST